MVQKTVCCLKVFALVGPFILLCCMGLLAGGNLLVLLEYGFGGSKNTVSVWTVCFAAIGDAQAKCVPVNDPVVCSELASKLNAIGIMTCISGFNLLLTIISIIADIQGCKVPVKNLTRLFFAWSIVPLILALAVAVMAMVNAQCGASQSLEDQEGSYGPAFQMIGSAFFGQFLGLIIHTCAMHFIGSSTPPSDVNDDEDEDEDEEGGNELKTIVTKPGGKAVAGKPSAKAAGGKPAAKGKAAGAKAAPKKPAAKRNSGMLY